ERTVRRDVRVKLTQAARGCVSGIGKRALSVFRQALVELLEVGSFDVNLTANLDPPGHDQIFSLMVEWDVKWNRTYRGGVPGDVLTYSAVPTGCRHLEVSLDVRKGYCKAVDF